MALEKGDLVLIDYVGRTDGEIFDLSSEEKAKENEVYDEEREYKPIPVLIGEEYVIEGLEEKIKEMDIDEETEVEVSAEKAYGEREADKMETFPEKEFKKQDVSVRVGERIMVGRKQGKVVSKGSGRVRIDFNHPLAGKDLDYWVKIQEKVEDNEEKAEYIFNYRLGHGDIKFNGKKATIIHTHEDDGHSHTLPEEAKEGIRDEIIDYTDIEEVEFEE
ncbi:MAG: FKBP-type peptidyl-prolyl cis-trans isomerase [Candidatus Nanohaloarchaea archaeon]